MDTKLVASTEANLRPRPGPQRLLTNWALRFIPSRGTQDGGATVAHADLRSLPDGFCSFRLSPRYSIAAERKCGADLEHLRRPRHC